MPCSSSWSSPSSASRGGTTGRRRPAGLPHRPRPPPASPSSSPSPSPSSSPAAALVLRLGWTETPLRLNPFTGTGTSQEIWRLNYDTLVGVGADGLPSTRDRARRGVGVLGRRQDVEVPPAPRRDVAGRRTPDGPRCGLHVQLHRRQRHEQRRAPQGRHARRGRGRLPRSRCTASAPRRTCCSRSPRCTSCPGTCGATWTRTTRRRPTTTTRPSSAPARSRPSSSSRAATSNWRGTRTTGEAGPRWRRSSSCTTRTTTSCSRISRAAPSTARRRYLQSGSRASRARPA